TREPRFLVLPVAQVNDLLVRTDLQDARVALDQADESLRVSKAVAAQRQRRALWPGLDALNPGLAAPAFDRDDLQEVLDFRRQRTEAVDQLGGKSVDVAPVGECGNAAVEPETHPQIGDPGFRDPDWRADRDLPAPVIGDVPRFREDELAAGRGHRLFEHVLIKLDPDLADMARLLVAPQIA